MGWVSAVRLKICQTSVAPAAGVSVIADLVVRPVDQVGNPWVFNPFCCKGSQHLNQAAVFVEVLVQGQRPVGCTRKWKTRSRRVAIVKKQSRLLSAGKEVIRQLRV